MLVTIQDLRAVGACLDQCGVFYDEWPNGCDVTRDTLETAVRLGLDIGWFAQRFLTGEGRDLYWKCSDQADREWLLATKDAADKFHSIPYTSAKYAQALQEYIEAQAGPNAVYDRTQIQAILEAIEMMEKGEQGNA